jgi:CheY-like chemotaxis protein
MRTVLLVDDDASVREILRLFAEGNGLFVVGEAVNGRQAVDMAARLRPHAIVLDQEMPEMTGLEALPRLRRRVPLAIIVMYSSGSIGTQEAAVGLGASAYLTKAETPKTVIQTVIELLEHRRPVTT